MTEEERRVYLRVQSNKYYHKHKELCAERARKYREANKERIQQVQKETKRERKLLSIEYLGGKCQRCDGEFHPAVYEFHHRDPLTKENDPSKMLSFKWERLTTELDKCELLCANCHRLTHHEEV